MFLAIVTKERLTQALSSLWQKILELLPNIVYNKELNSFIIGGKSKVQGANAVAMGLNCEANGKQSVAIGTETKAAGNHSFASGYQTEASKPYDHVEGYQSIAQGKASHAEGGGSVAGYDGSYNTLAENADTQGAYSHAEGNASAAAGCAAHAEGKKTYANGIAAHAEGAFTRAVGTAAHAEGQNTKAEASRSHAEGVDTRASAEGAHAEGVGNHAVNQGHHVSGKYATIDESGKAIFQVGIGESDTQRKDALRVTDDGRIFFRKEDEEVVLQEQLDSLYNSLEEKANAQEIEPLSAQITNLEKQLGAAEESIGKKADTTQVQSSISNAVKSLSNAFDGKLLGKADQSNLDQLEQEINTLETNTGRVVQSLNNSIETLNNNVGTLQEQQAGNDQEIANLQSELSSRVTKKQLDEALSDLSGSVGGGTSNVINDVSLFALRNSSNTDYTMLKAPQGLIKDTDKVIFARYIKNKTRPRVNGRTDKTKSRRVYKGWIRPRIGLVHEQYPLWMSDTRFELAIKGTIDGYDYFYIEDKGGDDIVTVLYDNSKAIQGKIYPKVVDKKLGIKIVRDGKTIVDYLPFTIKCASNVPYFGRI